MTKIKERKEILQGPECMHAFQHSGKGRHKGHEACDNLEIQCFPLVHFGNVGPICAVISSVQGIPSGLGPEMELFQEPLF